LGCAFSSRGFSLQGLHAAGAQANPVFQQHHSLLVVDRIGAIPAGDPVSTAPRPEQRRPGPTGRALLYPNRCQNANRRRRVKPKTNGPGRFLGPFRRNALPREEWASGEAK
jgi:hypothetical protein